MLSIKKFSISLLVLSVLQACGGGGGSSSGSSAPTPVTTYTFNLSADIKNECDQSAVFTDFELLEQDASWQTVNVHQPDVNGLVSFTTEQAMINYTIVAKSKNEDEREGYEVVSFANVSSSTASLFTANHHEMQNNDSCVCQTNDLVLTHQNAAELLQVSSSATFSDYEVIDDQNTRFNNVEACRLADGSWPTHSFMIKATDVNDVEFGAANFLNDFADDGIDDWQLGAFIQANNIEELDRNHPELTTYQSFGGLEHFPIEIDEEQTEVTMFNNHSFISEAYHVTSTENTFETLDGPFGTFTTGSQQIISSEVASTSLSAEALSRSPDFDENNPTMIESDSSYDYSDVASNYPFVQITYQLNAVSPIDSTQIPVTWTMYGPQTGVFPDIAPLTGYESTISKSTPIDSITIQLIKASTSNNFEDYIKAYQSQQEFIRGGTFDFIDIVWDPR